MTLLMIILMSVLKEICIFEAFSEKVGINPEKFIIEYKTKQFLLLVLEE